MFNQLFSKSFPRSLTWRAGRYLYMRARGDLGSAPQDNGEYALQERLLSLPVSERIWMDVGANIGEWTHHAIELANGLETSIHVHAFEPVDGTRLLAQKRLERFQNQLSLHSVAMSDEAGESVVHVSKTSSGTNSLVREPNRELVQQHVFLNTVDAFLEEREIAHVQFLKCDTEGHDFSVIKGARKTLSRGAVDVLQFEYNHRWVYARAFLKDVYDLTEPMAYTVGRLCADGIELVPRWHPELERFFECNWVLVSNPFIQRLDARRGAFTASNTYERAGR